MRIVAKQDDQTSFGQLCGGEVFKSDKFGTDHVFIKLYTPLMLLPAKRSYTAVDLFDGDAAHFDDNELVQYLPRAVFYEEDPE